MRVGPAQFASRPMTVDVDVQGGTSCEEAMRILERFYASGQPRAEIDGWECGVPGSGRAGILVSCGRPDGGAIFGRVPGTG